jgi:putative RNA 2'-phosphotransferase
MAINTVKISKILSLLLRHKPEKAGIELDKNGWVDVTVLINNFSEKFFPIDFEKLQLVVEQDNKQRYAFNSDKTKIRANQGHSIPVDLDLQPSVPPDILYHGTVERFIQSIRTDGLRKGNRQYVHLSKDRETAKNVGNRRGNAIILEIQAEKMISEGFLFYLSENKVWLTDFVPAKYINF